MHRIVAAIVLMVFSSIAAAAGERGFFTPQKPNAPTWLIPTPELPVTVISMTTVGEKKKPAEVIDKQTGRRMQISYHANGNVDRVTYPDQGQVFVPHYGDNGKPDGGAVIDLATGNVIYDSLAGRGEKLLSPDDPVVMETITVVGSYTSAFATDFWGGSGPDGFSWVQLQQDITSCGVKSCENACDVAYGVANIGCNAMDWAPPAALACMGVALVAWQACKQGCDTFCPNP